MVISTVPLNKIGSLIQKTPQEILDTSQNLKYNQITTMLWETEGVDATWTYFPEKQYLYHRTIHIGNFLSPKKQFCMAESVGVKSAEAMEQAGKNIPFLIKPLDYHVSDYAYVVYDDQRLKSIEKIKNYLNDVGIHTLGRFGEWEYYNMDICMESALNLSKKIHRLNP